MANRTTEDIIGELYDLVQDARAMPLAMDKCILERDKVLDLPSTLCEFRQELAGRPPESPFLYVKSPPTSSGWL